jgi:hypothetical protein
MMILAGAFATQSGSMLKKMAVETLFPKPGTADRSLTVEGPGVGMKISYPLTHRSRPRILTSSPKKLEANLNAKEENTCFAGIRLHSSSW